jgi:hypothetical protein
MGIQVTDMKQVEGRPVEAAFLVGKKKKREMHKGHIQKVDTSGLHVLFADGKKYSYTWQLAVREFEAGDMKLDTKAMQV